MGGALKGEKLDKETAGVKARQQDAFDDAYGAFSEQEGREAWSLHEQARATEQARDAQRASTGERESATAGSAKESGSQYGLRELAAKLESLSEQINHARGRSIALNQDQTAALINYISDQGRVPKGVVVQGIAEAAESGWLHTTPVGGKPVAEWVREWQEKNRPLAGPEMAELSEKASSLETGVSRKIEGGKEITSHERGKNRSSVEDRQAGTHDHIEKERSGAMAQVEDAKQNVENIRQGIAGEVDSKKMEVSEEQEAIGQSGEDLKGRVEKFQERGVSMNRVTEEGLGLNALEGKFKDVARKLQDKGIPIPGIDLSQDPSESQISQGRRELFPEGAGSPHPNFYAESREESLRKMKQEPERAQEHLERQREEMHKRLENVHETIEKLEKIGGEKE